MHSIRNTCSTDSSRSSAGSGGGAAAGISTCNSDDSSSDGSTCSSGGAADTSVHSSTRNSDGSSIKWSLRYILFRWDSPSTTPLVNVSTMQRWQRYSSGNDDENDYSTY